MVWCSENGGLRLKAAVPPCLSSHWGWVMCAICSCRQQQVAKSCTLRLQTAEKTLTHCVWHTRL